MARDRIDTDELNYDLENNFGKVGKFISNSKPIDHAKVLEHLQKLLRDSEEYKAKGECNET